MSGKTKTADSRRYPEHPIVGIGVVVWREDKVLLVKRKHEPRKGEWGLPGGRQDINETIAEAALREVREETGLDVIPLGVITAIDAISRDAKGKAEYHYTIVEFASESREGEAKAHDDVSELRWASLEEIERLCKWPEVARVVRLSLLQKAL